MQHRLIDANVLKSGFEEDGHLSPYIEEFIDACPTVEPVKHARWEKDKDDMYWGNSFIHMRCSLCGSEAHLNRFGMSYILSQFCPNCGAKMDGRNE
ncbi:MAG: hypothetical protein IKZ00_06290 [Bacteroidaceae bacterium]|nr:hypothetical protein [Bacteroidaceae bacterium]